MKKEIIIFILVFLGIGLVSSLILKDDLKEGMEIKDEEIIESLFIDEVKIRAEDVIIGPVDKEGIRRITFGKNGYIGEVLDDGKLGDKYRYYGFKEGSWIEFDLGGDIVGADLESVGEGDYEIKGVSIPLLKGDTLNFDGKEVSIKSEEYSFGFPQIINIEKSKGVVFKFEVETGSFLDIKFKDSIVYFSPERMKFFIKDDATIKKSQIKVSKGQEVMVYTDVPFLKINEFEVEHDYSFSTPDRDNEDFIIFYKDELGEDAFEVVSNKHSIRAISPYYPNLKIQVGSDNQKGRVSVVGWLNQKGAEILFKESGRTDISERELISKPYYLINGDVRIQTDIFDIKSKTNEELETDLYVFRKIKPFSEDDKRVSAVIQGESTFVTDKKTGQIVSRANGLSVYSKETKYSRPVVVIGSKKQREEYFKGLRDKYGGRAA